MPDCIPSRVATALRRFRRQEKGASMVLVAVAFAPIVIGGLALAIDTGMWTMEKRRTQQMADAAGMAAVRIIKDGGSLATAQQVALNDAQRNGYTVEDGNSLTVYSPAQTGPYQGQANTVEVIVTRKTDAYFFKPAATINARAVSYKPIILAKNVEVALMLDVSLSMNGNQDGTTKLQAMKDAAKALINTVVLAQQTPYSSRVALVPYSSAVNVGNGNVTINGTTKSLFQWVTNKSISGSWTSVVERSGAAQYTDDAPATTKYLQDFKSKRDDAMGANAWYVQNMNSNVPSSAAKIRPLSADKAALKTHVDGLTAAGTTAGHIGTAWSWYLLSPKWANLLPGSVPNAYNAAATYKAVVLLSDFDMNSYYVSGSNASQQTQTLCTNMKNAGIVVYTVGYNVDTSNSTAVNLWNNCASGTDKVFTANTVSELLAAFQAIANVVLQAVATDDIRLGE